MSRAQLLAAGLTAEAIRTRLASGRLHRLHSGVYAVGYPSPHPLARAMAAVLACGPRAVLSHRSAAALWEFETRWRRPIDVSAPQDRRHRGVRAHRSRTLTARDVTRHHGIPVTTPARTLLDLADVIDDRALARALNEARVQRRVGIEDVVDLLARSPGRRGAPRLHALIARPDAPTRSVFEDAFLAFTERHHLPRPEVNQHVAGHEVDMLWRRERLIVELDGQAYHDHARPFERDRDRDADLLAAGLPVVRVTWLRLTRQPHREARRLRKLLARPPSGARPPSA
jgi:very-short-patch-repair endonuclease